MIFTYIGDKIPDYVQLSINQAAKHNPNYPIYFIAKEPLLNSTWINSEEFNNHSLVKKFNEVSRLDRVSAPQTTYPGDAGFWHNTSARLFYLAAFMEANKLTHQVHLENDNLVYCDLTKLRWASHAISLPRLTETSFTWGICYIPYYIDIIEYCEFAIEMLQHHPYHDMDMAGLYPNIEELPVTWNEDVIFDPASYGQYLGGTNNFHPPGFIDENHIAGRELHTRKLTFDKIPRLDGTPIVNLHMHNKTRIKDFLS